MSLYTIGANILRFGSGGLFSVPAGFDFYISPTGTGTASGGGSLADPWPITMLNDSTARSRYRTKRVGLIDGTYDLYSAVNATSQYVPVLNVEGGDSGSPTIIQAVNPRQAILNGKSGSNYGGASGANDGTILVGNTPGTTAGYVEFRDLVLTGVKTCPLRIGVLDNSPGVAEYFGVVIDGCEIYDCSALTGLDAGGNLGGMSLNGCNGAIVNNNYIHDIVGYAVDSGDHTQGIIQWGTRNTTYTNNTLIRCGNGIYAKVANDYQNQYGGEIAYNYVDLSNNTDGGACIADFQGNTTMASGSTLDIHHNILIGTEPIQLHRGGTVQRMATETVRMWNNSLVLAGGFSGPASFAFFALYSPGAKFYNNLASNIMSDGTTKDLSALTTGDPYGAVCCSAGPQDLIDYNAYPTGVNRWSTFANGASTYPSSGYTTLAAWRTAMAGSTGAEAHSVSITDPLWEATGTLSEKYRLQSGSTAKLAGSSDGTTGGSAQDLGAWGNGAPAQIGCSFAP